MAQQVPTMDVPQNLPTNKNSARAYALDSCVVESYLVGALAPAIVEWINWQASVGTCFITDTTIAELCRRGFMSFGDIKRCYLTRIELGLAATLSSGIRHLDGGLGVFNLLGLGANDINIYVQAIMIAKRGTHTQKISFITNDRIFAKHWGFALQIISNYLHEEGHPCIPCVPIDALVGQGTSPIISAIGIASGSSGKKSAYQPQASDPQPSDVQPMIRAPALSGVGGHFQQIWRPKTRSMSVFEDDMTKPHTFLEGVKIVEEMQRQFRKQMTLQKCSKKGLYYVVDEAAASHASIKKIIASGHGVVVKDEPMSSFSSEELDACRRVCMDIQSTFLLYNDRAMLSSLHAYFLAGKEDTLPVAFVTGNSDMVKLVEEESTREELHSATRTITGFQGVAFYMCVDGGGKIKKIKLKWNDPSRPSDRRTSLYMLDESS